MKTAITLSYPYLYSNIEILMSASPTYNQFTPDFFEVCFLLIMLKPTYMTAVAMIISIPPPSVTPEILYA